MLREQRLHGALIEFAIGLGTRTTHRRALTGVQDAKLDTRLVNRSAHEPVERVDLAHQMPLTNPANRRIAGHGTDIGDIEGHQCSLSSQTRGGRSSLDPSVASTDYQNIKACIRHGLALCRRNGTVPGSCFT